MSTPTTLDILRQWLTANGYDGLCNDDPCGCVVDDLAPCGNVGHNCKAAYEHVITQEMIDTNGEGDSVRYFDDDLKVGDSFLSVDKREEAHD